VFLQRSAVSNQEKTYIPLCGLRAFLLDEWGSPCSAS